MLVWLSNPIVTLSSLWSKPISIWPPPILLLSRKQWQIQIPAPTFSPPQIRKNNSRGMAWLIHWEKPNIAKIAHYSIFKQVTTSPPESVCLYNVTNLKSSTAQEYSSRNKVVATISFTDDIPKLRPKCAVRSNSSCFDQPEPVRPNRAPSNSAFLEIDTHKIRGSRHRISHRLHAQSLALTLPEVRR